MQTLRANVEGIAASDCRSMTDVRREIDRIDRSLVQMLASRLTYIERAGQIKTDRDAVRDEERIRDVLAKVRVACAKEQFPFGIAEPVWRQLMEGCIAHEFVVYDHDKMLPKKASSAD